MTSREDFACFTTDELVRELQARAHTLVLGIEVAVAKSNTPEIGFFSVGDRFARLGMVTMLVEHLAHLAREQCMGPTVVDSAPEAGQEWTDIDDYKPEDDTP